MARKTREYRQEGFEDGWGEIPGLGSFYVACLHGKVVVARIGGATWLLPPPGWASVATAKAMTRGLHQLGLIHLSVESMETARKDDFHRKFLIIRIGGSEHFTTLGNEPFKL